MVAKVIFLLQIFLIAGCFAGQSVNITWTGQKGEAERPPEIIVSSTSSGESIHKVSPVASGTWQGMSGEFAHPVDLQQFAGIAFRFRHTIAAKRKLDVVIRLDFLKESGKIPYIYRNFLSGPGGEWKDIFVPFDRLSWQAAEKSAVVSFEKAIGITLYPFRSLNQPGQAMEIGAVSFIPNAQMSEIARIPVQKYNYIHPPTSGDPLSEILTDGKISKDSQIFYREYSDDFAAVFDLGGIYTVTRVELAAIAPASHNFSEMTVFAGLSNDHLVPVGSIKNQSDGSNEELCSWQLEHTFVARYVKLQAAKKRPDFPIHLSEVTFYGRLPEQEEMLQEALISYDDGPALGPRSDENCFRLDSGKMQCWISRQTGMINGIVQDNKIRVERVYHPMMMMTRDRDTEINPMLDRIVDARIAKNSAILSIINPELPGLQWTREYRLSENELYEKTSFEAAPEMPPCFLRIACQVVLNRDFRKNGVYESWGDAHHLAREFAQEILIDKNICNMPTMIFENPAENLTLLHHLYRYNERFIYLNSVSEEDHRNAFCPNGYRLALASITPARARHSFESRLAFTSGTLLEAYDVYRKLPDVNAFYQTIRRPKWLRDLKLHAAAGWQGNCTDGAERAMDNYHRLLKPNGFITGDIGSDLNSVWGEFPTSGRVFDSSGGYRSAEELRQRGQNLKKICPFLKIMTYTWAWSAYENSQVVQEHPEWFVRHLRNGARASWFPGSYRVNYLRLFGIPESRNEIRDSILKMLDFYQLDFWYLDGGGCGSYARDYDHMIQDDPHGNMDFLLDMRESIQKRNPEGIVFLNTPGNPAGDIGYLESFTGALTSSWRIGAAWMWKFKLFQYKDSLRYPSYIYWLSGIEGPFQNYLLGTGLLPAYNSRFFSTRDIPYLSARFEMRQLHLTEASVLPNWRTDPKTELECITQTQGKAGIVFMQQHGHDNNETVSVKPAALGMTNPEKNIWMWLFRIRNGKEFKGSFGERDIAEQYRKNHWRAERAVQSQFLGNVPWSERVSQEFLLHQNEGAVWMLTEVPAVIWSVDGLPSHFLLPSQPGISIRGDQKSLTVETEFPEVEVAVLLPDNYTPGTVYLNGNPAPFRVVMESNCRLGVVKLAESGSHQLKLDLIPAVLPPVDLPMPDIKIPGTQLLLSSTEPLLFGIFKDDSCVWSNTGTCFELDVKGAIENGNCELRIMAPDKKIQSVQTFTLKNAAVPTTVRRLVEHLKVLDRVDNRQLKAECGIAVSESRAAWSDGAFDPDETFADPEQLLLQCTTLPQQYSGWNFAAAGLEMQSDRYLRIELLNGMKEIRALNPGRHSVKYDDLQCLIGLIVDFATDQGYKSRTVASFGLQNEKRTSADPPWGARSKPDFIMVLNNIVNEHKLDRETLWLDLRQLGCPEDWNGKIYFNLVFGNVAPYRQFAVRILDSRKTLPENCQAAKPFVLSGKLQQTTVPVPQANAPLDWAVVPVLDSLHSTAPGAEIAFPTRIKAAYDKQNLYLHYDMKRIPDQQLTPGKGGKPWQGDGIEFLLQNPVQADRILHFISDSTGNFLAEDSDLLKRVGTKEHRLPENPITVESRIESDSWIVTMTLPWNFFGESGEMKGRSLAFNAMRNMINQNGNLEFFLLAPGTKYFSGETLKLLFQ